MKNQVIYLLHLDMDTTRSTSNSIRNLQRQDAMPRALSINITQDTNHVLESEHHDSEDLVSWEIKGNVEYAGYVVRWGKTVSSRQECISDCEKFNEERERADSHKDTKRCNVIVYCDGKDGCGSVEYRSCWLKHWNVEKNGKPATMSKGTSDWTIGWTSGLLYTQSEIVRYNNARAHAAAQELEQLTKDFDIDTLNKNRDVRMCDSPAHDAYENVNVTCLNQSPTAILYKYVLITTSIVSNNNKITIITMINAVLTICNCSD